MAKKADNTADGQKLSLINLERALRAGRTPEDLGLYCGGGVQKKAYLVTTAKGARYVVKRGTGGILDGLKRPPSGIRKFGLRPVYQTKAGQYVIQAYCTLIHKLDRAQWTQAHHDAYKRYHDMRNDPVLGRYDMHEGNVGFDENGTICVFDW